MLGGMKARTRKTHGVSIPSSRWLAYAGAGAATSLMSVSPADAEIHYSGHVDVTFQHNDTKTVQFSIEPGAFPVFRHDSDFLNVFGAAFFHAEGQRSGAFVASFSEVGYAYVVRIKGSGQRYISQAPIFQSYYYFGTMVKARGEEG